MIYKFKDIKFTYKLGSENIEALRGLSLEIPSRSLVTFSGPSGSGKSTLLNIMGLIEPNQSGTFLFEGQDIASLSSKELNEIRKFKIGFIFQHFHLIPVFTAEENVAYFLARQGLKKNEIQIRTKEALESVGLWEHRMKKPSEMSGGQKQRVAIARAIAKRPDVIIGDEPTASLDQKTAEEIMEIFSGLVKSRGVTIILSTHDKLIQSYADLNFVICDGLLTS